jgi:hypothetical protein
MPNKICPEIYKEDGEPNRCCILDSYHVGCCQDGSGFKFIVEHLAFDHKVYWPDRLGNGPSGYPMNNEAFDKAVKKVLNDRKEDIRQAEEFLEKLGRS